jgi:hypothetical protein
VRSGADARRAILAEAAAVQEEREAGGALLTAGTELSPGLGPGLARWEGSCGGGIDDDAGGVDPLLLVGPAPPAAASSCLVAR